MAALGLRRIGGHRTVCVVLSAMLVMTACSGASTEGAQDSTSSAPSAATSETQPAEGWTFTDGRGETVELDSAPTKIVANTEFAMPPLLRMGIQPIAAFGAAPIADTPSLEGLDASGIEEVGTVDGEINVEALAALEPDLIVTTVTEPYVTGFADDAQVELVESIAPIVALDALKPTSEALDDWLALGEALGADLQSPELVAAKERYETAAQALQEAASAKPDLTFMYASLIPDAVYVANPDAWGDLQELQSLGLDFYKPDGLRGDAFWNEGTSWERAAEDLAVDVVLWDARPYSSYLPPDERTDLPGIWKRLPAVEVDQYGPWRAQWNTSYEVYASSLEELTELIERSEPVGS